MKKILVIVAALVFMFLFVAQASADLVTQVVMDVDSVKVPGYTGPATGNPNQEVQLYGGWIFEIVRNDGTTADYESHVIYLSQNTIYTLAFLRESGKSYNAKIRFTNTGMVGDPYDRYCNKLSGAFVTVAVKDFAPYAPTIYCPDQGGNNGYMALATGTTFDFGAV